jgi:hypothetical protein
MPLNNRHSAACVGQPHSSRKPADARTNNYDLFFASRQKLDSLVTGLLTRSLKVSSVVYSLV